MTGSQPTAALVLVGDELLSGKVEDTNSGYLIEALRESGVALRLMLCVPDEVDRIAWALRQCMGHHDHVFTSGGIGPTHDDVTAAGVALALDVPLTRHPELEEILRGHFGDRITDVHLKMAEMPQGTVLYHGGGIRWPVLEPAPGIFMLPGIPEIFRDKVDALRPRLRGAPATCRWVFTRLEEGVLAPHLDAVLSAGYGVRIGSYPVLGEEGFRVKVALEGLEADRVDEAVAALLARLPEGAAWIEP